MCVTVSLDRQNSHLAFKTRQYQNIILLWAPYVTVLEKRSNFAPNINFELGVSLNRAISELQNGLSSMKNGQS